MKVVHPSPVACEKIPLCHLTRDAAQCSTYTLSVRVHLDWQLKQISRQITCVGVTGRAIPRRTEIWEDKARSTISLHVGSTVLRTEWVHGWMWGEGRQLLCATSFFVSEGVLVYDSNSVLKLSNKTQIRTFQGPLGILPLLAHVI